MNKLVYVAHPFGGLTENKAKIDAVMEKLIFNDKRNVYVSPIHNFSFAYLDGERYQEGLDICLGLLKKCDVLVLCHGWEESRGCREEKDEAEYMHKPIYLLSDWLQMNHIGGRK